MCAKSSTVRFVAYCLLLDLTDGRLFFFFFFCVCVCTWIEANADGSKTLDFEEFTVFFTALTERPEITALFKSSSGGTDFLKADQVCVPVYSAW